MSVEKWSRPVGWWFLWVAMPFAMVTNCAAETADTDAICHNGSFSFEGGDVWNTNDSLWTVDKCRRFSFPFRMNHFMALSFSDDTEKATKGTMTGRGSTGLPHRGYHIHSPPLCSPHNGTYQLSFRYSIPGFFGDTSCFLAVYLWDNSSSSSSSLSSSTSSSSVLLWRSSGGTLNFFFELSPPLKFTVCSTEFRLIFEGAKVSSGKCGTIFNRITFDDVKFTYVPNPSRTECSDDPPIPWTAVKPSINIAAVFAIIVSLAVVIIVLAALALTAVCIARKRKKLQAPFKVHYRSFANETKANAHHRESGNSDYESYNAGDDADKSPLRPSASGGSDVYDRLHDEEGGPQAHYDHFDGNDMLYNDLHQTERTRERQRLKGAEDYSHV